MAVYKCKMCGGDLNVVENSTTAECEYCGSLQTVPTVDNEKKVALFTRANRLRLACEFDKASGVFESIIAEFPEEAEAYWGLVLCKYGIEYVDDPATAKKIPTCHRSSFDSVMDDNNFDLAMENADAVARKVYLTEAKAFEEIRKGIIKISSTEEPYDVFICYKETDEFGDRTEDSRIAQDVYDRLTDKGYRVFFSRITLEDKLGVEYEPYIFAALNSAKIMLAFGTSYEYFNAVWVKNEWSRFLEIKAKDSEKRIIPCYVEIDDVPKELRSLQGQDIRKIGADQDIVHGVEKIIPKKVQPIVQQVSVISNAENNKLNSLLDRGRMALEDGDFLKADSFFEDVLNNDSKCADAYLGKTLAAEKCRTLTALVRKRKDAAVIKGSSNHNIEKDALHVNEALKKYTVKGYLKDSEINKLYDFNLSYTTTVDQYKKLKENEVAYWENNIWLSKALAFASGDVADSINKSRMEVYDHIDRKLKEAEDKAKTKKLDLKEAYKKHIEEADAKVLALYEKAIKRRDTDYKYYEEDANKLNAGLESVISGLKKMHPYKDSGALIKICEDKERANKDALEAEIARRTKLREDKLDHNKKFLKVFLVLEALLLVVGSLISYYAVSGGPGKYDAITLIIGELIASAIVQLIIAGPVTIATLIAFITAVKKDSFSSKVSLIARVISAIGILVFGGLLAATIAANGVNELPTAIWWGNNILVNLVPFVMLFFKKKDE